MTPERIREIRAALPSADDYVQFRTEFRELLDLAEEAARLTDLLRRTDLDLQQARYHADQKWALRREVEELLGVADGPAGDEQFAAGVAALRSLVGIRSRVEARLREFAIDFGEGQCAACLRGILVGQP